MLAYPALNVSMARHSVSPLRSLQHQGCEMRFKTERERRRSSSINRCERRSDPPYPGEGRWGREKEMFTGLCVTRNRCDGSTTIQHSLSKNRRFGHGFGKKESLGQQFFIPPLIPRGSAELASAVAAKLIGRKGAAVRGSFRTNYPRF